jgi:nitrate/nitrite transport system permease protein
MTTSLALRSTVLSIALFLCFILAWHLVTRAHVTVQAMDPEYAKLMGMTVTQGKSAMPGPLDVAAKIWDHLKDPFYDRGSNDKGLGIQLAYSIARVMVGYLIAVAVAIPIGFLIGMSPLLSRALDPFIQILKPISPLAWMPLALYTIKDSSLSAIFVIFICSLWPTLINTAFGSLRCGANGSMSPVRSRSACFAAPSPSFCRRPRQRSSPGCASQSELPGW